MIKVLHKNQLSQYTEYLNKDMISYLHRGLTEAFEEFSDYDLMAFQWYDIRTNETGLSQIIIYIDREDLFLICEDERSFTLCSKLLGHEESNERSLYLFLVGLLSDDAQRLNQYENKIIEVEDAMLENSRIDYLNNIREFRKELLRLKRYYEELHTITDYLTANDNNLFSKNGERDFAIIHNRISHLSSNVMSLREYVTQMREACQSQIDYEQNNLMKVFTVIATIFLPLTLIVGWYGMNFTYMPELTWRYGYIGVIALSLAVCIALILWFKHKKWF